MSIEDQTTAFPKPLLDDPLAFAEHVFGERLAHDPRLATHARDEFRRYNAALSRLKQLHPGEDGFGAPLALLDEAVLAWGGAAFWEGVRFAVETDALRRSLLAMATKTTGET